jgi:hypothetical protein
MITETEDQLNQCQRTLAHLDLQDPSIEAEVKGLDLACVQYRRRIDALKARTIEPMD